MKKRDISGLIPEQLHTKDPLRDVITGIIVGMVSIPISMGYAQIAGLTPVYGLYGSLLPILVFGLISSSRRFVFGVDAAPAALTGGILAAAGVTAGSGQALKLVPAISLLTAVWLLLFFLADAGRIVRFISASVMGGFITGIGITIILMQVPKLFGGSAGRGELPELIRHIYTEASQSFHLLSFLLGLGTILIIRVFARKCPAVPMAVIMMGAGMAAGALLGLEDLGVRMLPAVQAGLPVHRLPDLSVIFRYGNRVVFSSLTIALVITSETLLASTNLARKHDEKLITRREVLAYCLANVLSALCGCCPTNGSVSRSGLADQYGVHSQIMSVTASAVMGLILLFFTGLIVWLPVPVLTGIVISALLGTLEFDLIARMRKVDKAECLIFLAACLIVLFYGTIYGVVAGALLSFAAFVIRSSRPETELLGWSFADSRFMPLGETDQVKAIEGVVIYRFHGPLFFANVEQFWEEILEAAGEDVRVIVVDGRGISSIDAGAVQRLLMLYTKLKERGIEFFLTEHSAAVNRQLTSLGAPELISMGAVRPHIAGALASCGIKEPYIASETAAETETEEDGLLNFSEYEWAYGEEKAAGFMEETAEKLAARLVSGKELKTEEIRRAERDYANGFWSMVDEYECLCHLQIHLAAYCLDGSFDEGRCRKYEDRLSGRRDQIEQTLKRTDPEAYEYILRYRKKLSEEAFLRNPEIRDLTGKQ